MYSIKRPLGVNYRPGLRLPPGSVTLTNAPSAGGVDYEGCHAWGEGYKGNLFTFLSVLW